MCYGGVVCDAAVLSTMGIGPDERRRVGYAPMESFFGSLKTECVHRHRFKTRKQAKAALFDYIEIFYNRQRLHSAIGYKAPMEAYLEMTMKAA